MSIIPSLCHILREKTYHTSPLHIGVISLYCFPVSEVQ